MKHPKLMAASGLLTLALAGAAQAGDEPEAELLAALDSKIGRANALRTNPQAGTSATGNAMSLFRMAGIAGALAMVAFAAAYVVKRRKEAELVEDGGPELSIKESVWVGRGQRLLLVSVQGQPVLVGATAQGMFGLGTLAPTSAAGPSESNEAKDDPFSKYVDDALGDRSQRQAKRRMLSRLNSL